MQKKVKKVVSGNWIAEEGMDFDELEDLILNYLYERYHDKTEVFVKADNGAHYGFRINVTKFLATPEDIDNAKG